MTAEAPRITVSLVTYNGAHWLPACVASIRDQTWTDYELLVVDNASADGSLHLVRRARAADARISVVESPDNLGFAAAHNRNIASARGEFVVLVNQDVVLDPEFLAVLISSFERDPGIAAVQGWIGTLGPDGEQRDTVDTTGLVMQRDRRVVSRDQGRRDAAEGIRAAGPVWGVDGPVAAYRRAALQDAQLPSRSGGWEVLDEDFFMYKEDVDLAWRLRLLGWKTVYEPRARAWHARSASGPAGPGWRDIVERNRLAPRWIRVLSWRNQRLMQLKNESLAGLRADMAWILRREILSLGYIVVADPGQLAALPQLMRRIPGAIAKRRYLLRLLRDRARTGPAK